MGLRKESTDHLLLVAHKKLIMKNSKKKMVVIGGGFAGMNLVKAFAGNENFEVTLVDIDNYHSFSPLLYQVGMAFIEPSDISYPFRRLFQDKKTYVFI